MHPFLGGLNYEVLGKLPPSFEKWENQILRVKGRILAGIPSDRLSVVAPSRWMAEQARRSAHFFRFQIRHIPYGIDPTRFFTADKGSVRRALNIPEGKIIIGVAAQNLNERRKGMAVLRAALELLGRRCQEFFLLTAGRGWAALDGFDTLHLGSLDSDSVMTLFYNALDLFVCPSLQDNLPNTVLEALSCGVPVMAFDTGGIPDLVRPEKTGWLASPVGEASSLASMIIDGTKNRHELSAYSARCRATVESEYGLQRQAQACIATYAEQLHRTGQP
jgi:glycosyltransferase involved in cell wall biosynthesis